MNVNEIKSDFQFLGNRIVEFSIKTENSTPGKLEIEYDIDYNINQIIEKEEMLIGTLDFIAKIQGKTNEGAVPLLIQLVMEGGFAANKEKVSNDQFGKLLEQNGLVALSQISRSYIVSATSLSGISPSIKLPMINIFSLIEKKKEKNN
jgi:hypothetical protein